ncbi:PREDICTED: CWF19-like protein 2 [Amphimedon queenslandica]|uniref:CWF19-like protein 2 n=1 Tax=Amphimedon queenslandica TaxID=400682 RepID=A0A1X7VPT9_AMPQE|nr:PREDICTED: CWF19-like protein 2 [Amphimedon queenslandica]|eukprot:XP_003383183.1 PREDICTED: CWF19-like protein 2 [Amphimedon queenslandica]
MSFVSASDLEAQRQKRKEEKRQSRQKILHEAKEKFLEERKRQELKRERGDDVWVAPGVSKRLNLTTKKHKKDKKKKKKQEKREKADVKSEESGEEEEWIEKEGEDVGMETEPVDATPTPTPDIALQRDEWMTLALGPSLSSQRRLEELRKRTEEEEEKKKEPLIDQAGQHPLELNPYWRKGGTGLPEQSDVKEDKKSTQIGDGGRSWLLRSYKRALERAEQEGRSIEEIAAVQWGSVDKLHEMLREAGIDPNNPDGHYKGKRELYSRMERHREVPYGRYERDSSRYSPREDKRERRRDRFIKPSFEEGKSTVSLTNDESSNSWRKKTIQLPTSLSPPPPPTVPSVPDKPSSLLPSPSFPPPPPPPPPPPLVTSTQLNSLAAKIMKAEMFGDSSKVERLKNELKQLQELKSKQDLVQPKDKDRTTHQTQRGGEERGEKGEEVVLLTKTDRHGNVRPLSRPSRSGYEGPLSTHTGKGKRTKYFKDDDTHSLKSLLEAERLSSSDDTQAAILKMASKFVPSSSDRGDETVDDVLDTAALHGKRKKQLKEEEREMRRAINENKRMMDKLDSCRLCFDSSQFEKHLLIAVGINVYLSLPSVQSLTDGHCLLVPMEHTQSSLLTDENVWSEFNLFRKGLTRMFADRDMDVVFMETYTSSKSHSHMIMECVPLPKEVGELAPMYYKKALQESDQEWSDNKKVIDTSKKGVRGSLPVGLPFFYVEFGTDGGYGHIIEDNSKFPHYFGKEVAGGMLDVEPRLWLKPHRESFERQKEKVLRFCEWWSPYDWTQKLREEDKSNETD